MIINIYIPKKTEETLLSKGLNIKQYVKTSLKNRLITEFGAEILQDSRYKTKQ